MLSIIYNLGPATIFTVVVIYAIKCINILTDNIPQNVKNSEEVKKAYSEKEKIKAICMLVVSIIYAILLIKFRLSLEVAFITFCILALMWAIRS